jgi:hypothetical protein
MQLNSFFPIIFFLFLSCKNIDANAKMTASKSETKEINVDTIPIGKKLISIAKTHLGKPYLAHTLDKEMVEKLTVRMDGFDCTTLVETVLAQAKDATSYENHVLLTRYRNGLLTDYASRIHYFTEWIYENQKNGIVEDVTSNSTCSIPFPNKVYFMSKNRSKYPQLKSDSIYEKIKTMETSINQYKWHYIPKSELTKCENEIKQGDIIAITSNVPGLDIAHLGFAYWERNILYFLHASTDEKKIVITKKTMKQYLMSHQKQTGIMIVRVKG